MSANLTGMRLIPLPPPPLPVLPCYGKGVPGERPGWGRKLNFLLIPVHFRCFPPLFRSLELVLGLFLKYPQQVWSRLELTPVPSPRYGGGIPAEHSGWG